MEVRSFPDLVVALRSDRPRLISATIEHLNQRVLENNPGLERTIEALLDCLFVSLTHAKSMGLLSWAEHQNGQLSRPFVYEIFAAACHVLAGEGDRFDVDHCRLLAFLEVLKSEVANALAARSSADVPALARLDHGEPVQALLTMLGARDEATCCHSKATAEWARRLSTAMQLPHDTVGYIELCALLHDIGKVSTPDSVLFKEGALSEPEWTIMRKHAGAGEKILNQIPTLQRCAVIVRSHHERFDGAGYPDGLCGHDIPFEARVVAVADAFHAMISTRPYRKAIPARIALEILENGAGSQWDPEVVHHMLRLFKKPEIQTPVYHEISSA